MNKANPISFKKFKIISFVFLGSFVLLLILLHFLDPQVGFATGFVSNFALGNFNLLFILCLSCLTISKYLLSKLVGFTSGNLTPNNYKHTKWLQFFILFSAATNFLIGVFPTQYGPNINIVGYLHLIFAYLSFISTAIFLTLFAFEKSSSNQSKILKFTVAGLYLLCLFAYPFSSSLAPIAERVLITMVVLGIFTNLVLIKE